MSPLILAALAGCGEEPAELVEYCDGIDNDYDGLIDDGLPDGDADGIIDCKDDRCGTVAGPGEVAAGCEGTTGDPWAPTTLWHWTHLSADTTVYNVATTPVVANLDDDDGDGKVDAGDVPDVVFVAFGTDYYNGTLVVLDGATGAEKWTLAGYDPLIAAVALGDVDGDGVADIVVFDTAHLIVALDASGGVIWTDDTAVYEGAPAATLADLDGDGDAEVIAGRRVLDGATGALIHTLPIPASSTYGFPAVADLDEDGVQELIVGETVYDGVTGEVRWQGDFSGTFGQWPVVIDADPSPGAEVAFVGAGRYGLWTAQGERLLEVELGGLQSGGPCAGDFDGDGAPDVAWPDESALRAVRADGTQLWEVGITDFSGLASCAAFDVDGDGAAEVLFADEIVFAIFDGRTGTPRYSWGEHVSATNIESPAVADVDGDGYAEILVVGNDLYEPGAVGVAAFTAAPGLWSKAPLPWSQHDGGAIDDDGAIPTDPTPAWKTWNGYRGRPGDGHRRTDLTATIPAVCTDNCLPGAPVAVAVHVANRGGSDAAPGIPVTLYRDDGGALTPLLTKRIVAPIPGGTVYDGLVFDITSDQVGSDGLVVGVDDDGAGGAVERECDEANNRVAWTGPGACP